MEYYLIPKNRVPTFIIGSTQFDHLVKLMFGVAASIVCLSECDAWPPAPLDTVARALQSLGALMDASQLHAWGAYTASACRKAVGDGPAVEQRALRTFLLFRLLDKPGLVRLKKIEYIKN